ncbi:PA2169 family four-helix-bundle protein [Methylocystis sp. B8]|uniref:PA2169 family four-helix-bundle protein n=1 Tax=Methylocystis sp. B8 TaxID=544938 RepID=UPI0010FEAD45|nr:PA2169 family four-helix-bundle protein [Methylocystis sp. B8]TLG71829.1 PA2169 family four-helix-bundle protein [Methylocystis sp. B8]
MTGDPQSVLKNLAEVSRDGEKGFASAAEAAKDQKLRRVFEKASQRCALGAQELEEEIVNLGGSPSTQGSTLGALHRAWTKLKAVITDGDDKTILEECERGEDVAKTEYQKALEEDLPPYVHDIIERQYKGVMENHDLIKRLRNAA